MKRITQSLFEDIQKITSGQIDEKKLTHDEDKDGDEDAADYMMKRRKAGGQSHTQAHAATRKHNEETEQDGEELEEDAEQLDEIGDTPAGKQALGTYVKKRAKQLPNIEVNYQMAPSEYAGMAKKYKNKVQKGIGRAVDRLTKEDVEKVDEVMWPGTPEYNKKFPKVSKPGQRMSKQDYGYRGPSGSETEEKPSSEEGKTRGKGRRKVREETVVKHDDFTLEVIDNPTFKDFFNAAKTYVDNADDAVVVAESFFNDQDYSLIIESELKKLYKDTLDNYEKDGYVIEDTKVTIDEDSGVSFEYTLVKEDKIVNYIHHGIVVVEDKGEE